MGKYLRLLCNDCLFLNSTALLATSVWLQTLVHIFSLFYNPELESNPHSDGSLWFQGAQVQICHFENTAALSFKQPLMHRDVAHVYVFSFLYASLFAWNWHSSPQVVWSLRPFLVLLMFPKSWSISIWSRTQHQLSTRHTRLDMRLCWPLERKTATSPWWNVELFVMALCVFWLWTCSYWLWCVRHKCGY